MFHSGTRPCRTATDTSASLHSPAGKFAFILKTSKMVPTAPLSAERIQGHFGGPPWSSDTRAGLRVEGRVFDTALGQVS